MAATYLDPMVLAPGMYKGTSNQYGLPIIIYKSKENGYTYQEVLPNGKRLFTQFNHKHQITKTWMEG